MIQGPARAVTADSNVPEPGISGQLLRRGATALLAIYWITLLTATHWPFKIPPQPQPMLSSDKALHFSAYAGLAFLFVLVAQLRRATGVGRVDRPIPIAALLMLTITAGFLDEITQPLTARDFEWMDWAADSLGAISGIALGVFVGRFFPSARRKSYDESRPEVAP